MRRNQEEEKSARPDTRRKSIVVPPSRIVLASRRDEDEDPMLGVEETEIAAQVMLSVDGGWAWVVLICATLSSSIVDGTLFTFGALLQSVAADFKVADSLAAIVNSTAIALYFLMAPASSALVNRFGFRAMGMTGSIITSMAIFGTYFSKNFISMLFLYGVVNGIGLSICNITSLLVCGFYFERLRKCALTVVSTGSSIGVMVLYPTEAEIVKLSSWRTVILFQAGLMAVLYFLYLSFRPLLNLTVSQTEDEGSPTRTVTYLPTMSNVRVARGHGQPSNDQSKATKAERMLMAVSNVNFPRATAVMNTAVQPDDAAGPSTGPRVKSRITLKASAAVNHDQLQQMKSIVMSRRNLTEPATKPDASAAKAPPTPTNLEIVIDAKEESQEKTCCGRLFHWRSSPPDTRPLYRDDAFYEGEIEKLPEYKDNVLAVAEEDRTGLEYQLAVTRAAAVSDLEEKRGLCTQAVRRVLASMLDPTLLRKTSFMLFCAIGFFLWSGVMIPYVYIQSRAVSFGLDSGAASFLVSAISIAGVFGKIFGTVLASKFDTVVIYGICLCIAGTATILSGLSYTVEYQYGYAILFGLTWAPSSSLRSVILVESYGLENLTNAIGLVLMLIGVANMYSSPLAAVLKDKFGIEAAFYAAGGCIVLSGFISIFFKFQLQRERNREENEKKQSAK